MLIDSRQRLLNAAENCQKIEIGGTEIKQISSTKSLGVLIDENLCWNEQIDSIRAIGMIRRAKPYVNFDTLNLIYQSLVLPYFDHCSIWCGETVMKH